MDRGEVLADAHWGYIKSLIQAHGVDDETIELCGFHYKSAFIHGYKHGIEDEALVDDVSGYVPPYSDYYEEVGASDD